jgi:hypothetical protein
VNLARKVTLGFFGLGLRDVSVLRIGAVPGWCSLLCVSVTPNEALQPTAAAVLGLPGLEVLCGCRGC